MSWVTIIWSMSAAMSLTLGAIHFVVWLQDRTAWANFVFSITALAVASFAACELGLMNTDSIERFGALIRWGHVPLFVLVAGVVGFTGLYFGTGRWWLGCAAVGVRLVSLGLNFVFAPNLNYHEISALKQIEFLGDRVWVVAQSIPSHRTRIAELSSLLVLIFVVDASLTLCRKGGREERRRAAVVQRLRDPLATRRRHRGVDHALEMSVGPMQIADTSQIASARRAAAEDDHVVVIG